MSHNYTSCTYICAIVDLHTSVDVRPIGVINDDTWCWVPAKIIKHLTMRTYIPDFTRKKNVSVHNHQDFSMKTSDILSSILHC